MIDHGCPIGSPLRCSIFSPLPSRTALTIGCGSVVARPIDDCAEGRTDRARGILDRFLELLEGSGTAGPEEQEYESLGQPIPADRSLDGNAQDAFQLSQQTMGTEQA